MHYLTGIPIDHHSLFMMIGLQEAVSTVRITDQDEAGYFQGYSILWCPVPGTRYQATHSILLFVSKWLIITSHLQQQNSFSTSIIEEIFSFSYLNNFYYIIMFTDCDAGLRTSDTMIRHHLQLDLHNTRYNEISDQNMPSRFILDQVITALFTRHK